MFRNKTRRRNQYKKINLIVSPDRRVWSSIVVCPESIKGNTIGAVKFWRNSIHTGRGRIKFTRARHQTSDGSIGCLELPVAGGISAVVLCIGRIAVGHHVGTSWVNFIRGPSPAIVVGVRAWWEEVRVLHGELDETIGLDVGVLAAWNFAVLFAVVS